MWKGLGFQWRAGPCKHGCKVVKFVVLMTRHFGRWPFAIFYKLGVPEQALGGIPIGLGLLKLLNVHVLCHWYWLLGMTRFTCT